MDNYRQGEPQNRRRNTIDGFVQRGSYRGSAYDASRSLRPRQTAERPERRPIDDFRRTNRQQRLQHSDTYVQPRTVHRTLPSINLALPEASAQPRTKRGVFRTKKRSWLPKASAAFLVAVLGVAGVLVAQGYLKLQHTFNGGASAVALQGNVDPSKLKGEGDGRVNILLMGAGGEGHDGANLTDTIMVASIDPVNKTASLLSVPRDLWVTIPKHGNMKLNAAYETGKFAYLGKMDFSNSNKQAVQAGFALADQTIEQVLGVTIHYNVLVDFRAFQQAVDTVGGVTVHVPEQLYDPTMAWENKWNPVLAKAGDQTFDGKHALMYVRSRETSSDFARSERQRAMLVALKSKVVSLGILSNPIKISQLMNAFGNNVQTDLSLNDAARLYDLTKGIGDTSIKSIALTGTPEANLVTTDAVGNQSVVRPKAGFFVYSAIQSYVRNALQDGYIMKEHAAVTVLNGTERPGLATAKADELKSYGYTVIKVDNAPTSAYNQTVVVDLSNGKKPYTRRYLEQRFGTSAVSRLPDTTIQPGTADFIIILGDDETAASQN